MRQRILSVAAITGLLAFGGAIYSGSLQALFSSDYLPHRFCYLAQPGLIWTNVLADTLIAAAYVALFVALAWAVVDLKRTSEIRAYLWVFASFGAFILACGVTHVMEVVTVWLPVYRLSAAIKLVCALISVPTAVLFVWKVRALARGIHDLIRLVSTRQQQTEALRKSEAFLDRTGRIAGIGGWEVDLVADQVTWSAETYRIHGAALDYRPTLEEGIKMYAPEARPTIIAAILTASAGGPGWDLELPVIRLDGRRVTVRCVGEVDFRNGNAVRLLGAFQDITEQVAARAALRQANERVALATESGGIGIFDWDIKLDLCTADPWMHRLYGLEPPGCATPLAYWAAPMHPDDRDGVIEALDDAIADLRSYDTEFRVIWQDCSVHHIRATARVTRDERGTPVHMVGVNWDVTESRRRAKASSASSCKASSPSMLCTTRSIPFKARP